MIPRFAITLALVTLAPGTAAAQTPGQHDPHAHAAPPFEESLFPPELVMQHQRELDLTAQQRATITEAVKALQHQVVDLQWELQDEQQKLTELVRQASIQEAAALAQIDRLLDLERQVKKAHLLLLVRIKNTLTPQQQQTLTGLRGPVTPRPDDPARF